MSAAVASWNWRTLENVEVECTHCGVRMTSQVGTRVKYFRCGSCHRWVSSTYTDVLRADAKMRTHPVKEKTASDERFLAAKEKLSRWVAALDDQDPYRVMGVSPLDSAERIRARYRELALERHPDRGGSAERMQELNVAYERILRHHERRRTGALRAGGAPVGVATSLPMRGR
ncbi:MAG TPA: J domain-containing protein [Myxococcaceae bacterium]|nr:J domain-containing protein [Myxococcaceae bacterium]